jgi:hypothetical protein
MATFRNQDRLPHTDSAVFFKGLSIDSASYREKSWAVLKTKPLAILKIYYNFS